MRFFKISPIYNIFSLFSPPNLLKVKSKSKCFKLSKYLKTSLKYFKFSSLYPILFSLKFNNKCCKFGICFNDYAMYLKLLFCIFPN